jgi:hypothetical protein
VSLFRKACQSLSMKKSLELGSRRILTAQRTTNKHWQRRQAAGRLQRKQAGPVIHRLSLIKRLYPSKANKLVSDPNLLALLSLLHRTML